MTYLVSCVLLFTGVGLSTALSISAQFPMADGPTADRARSTKTEDTALELEERMASMRYMIDHAEDRKGKRKKDPELALKELQEDFTHLQLINKDLVLKVNATSEIDIKFVARSTGEINKRAERLLVNLALPDPGTTAPRPGPDQINDSRQLKTSITKLGWLIYYFTKNPIFKEAQVIDATFAAKARRDLDSILELSQHIRKSTGQLQDTPH